MDRYAELQRFWPNLARIAATYEAVPSIQNELQQEMALAIWLALPRFRADSSVVTFMYKVAHNTGVSHVKKEMRHRHQHEEMDSFMATATTEADVESSQRIHQLMVAVRQLTVIDRQLITLSLDGVKQQDIAVILGLSENNVAVRLNRAKHALKTHLTHLDKSGTHQ